MKQINLTVLLTVLMSMVGTKASAHDIEVENADGVTIYYNFINDGTELEVTYQGSSSWNDDYVGEVVIPESVTHDGNTYSVTAIGNRAFQFCYDLTSVTIPNSVTTISNGAFSGCSSLTSMDIPNSVTSIGNEAFEYCSSLTELTIPNSVKFIGAVAFHGCKSLTEVTIPNSVITILNGVFEYCSGLEKIIVESDNPFYDSRENCNAIIETNSNELIAGCKNTIIPNSVTSIYFQAFSGCSGLTELTIPNSVTSIAENAFSGCNGLEKITVESDNPIYDSRENCNAIIETNNNKLITGCKNTIIPNSVTSIGNFAFVYCSGLTELTLPNSVTSIGRQAFYDCTSLTALYSLNPTPPSIADTGTFDSNHYMNVNVYVPKEALTAYQSADVWKEFWNLYAIDDVSTAVTQPNATTDAETVTVYTLEGKGQTMKKADVQSLPKGIYIVDGQKVVVK